MGCHHLPIAVFNGARLDGFKDEFAGIFIGGKTAKARHIRVSTHLARIKARAIRLPAFYHRITNGPACAVKERASYGNDLSFGSNGNGA